jgi:ribosomal protein L12E/L44/L45/RPP1/RPP2
MAAPTVLEVTAGEVTEVLKRQGIAPDERVTVTIEPELMPGRRESRARVVAAGLTDDDIDRLIKQAQRKVEPLLPGVVGQFQESD